MTTSSNMPNTLLAVNKKSALPQIPAAGVQTTNEDRFNDAKSVTFTQNFGGKFFAFAKQLEAEEQLIFWAAFKLLIFRLTLQNQIFIDIVTQQHPMGHWLHEPQHTTQLHTTIAEQMQFTTLLQTVRSAYQNIATAPKISSQETGESSATFYYTFPTDVKEPTATHANAALPDAASLQVCFRYTGETICLTIAYNALLYEASFIQELLRQYQLLLEQIIAHPGHNILQYSLLTEEARKRLPDPAQPLIKQWSQSIPDFITEQALNRPEATAVVDGQTQWSYADLETLSNRIANYLVSVGLQERDVVAVYASREASMVASILGILKAGAAFMILDPGYPYGRLLKQLTIGQPKAFLHIEGAGTLPAELEQFLNSQALHYLKVPNLLAALPEPLAQVPTTHPAVTISPAHLAYIAFTSGSTGEPKGILGTHLPLAHFFPWHIQQFGLQRSDNFSMLSGLSHDPILRDMFTPLCLGATLFIPRQSSLFDSEQLFNWLKTHKISVMHLTPSLSQVITTRALTDHQTLPDMRYAFFGGEKLEHKIVENFLNVATRTTCVNFYGATETPQAMAYHIVKPQTSLKKRQRIPLGQGIANVQLLVLNQNKQLAGINELGEIYIRTPYLSEGYLGDPALTQQKFLINPFTQLPEDRLYKTGDMGRYRADGLINFFNRKDHQVNIRGFRIELGEIRHTLESHPAIYDCHIDVKETAESKQIVAFYRAAQPISLATLKTHLKSQLPYYMVPTAYIFVKEYPRTPNGKIDTRRLLTFVDKQAGDKSHFVPPQTAREKQIAEMWQNLLNVKQVGLHDDFFDLGGHSILAIEMLIQVREAFGVEISPNELFQKGTIAQICDLIEALKTGTAVANPRTFKSLISVHATTEASQPNLFCVHGGGGNILFMQEWKKHMPELKLNLYGFQARGIDGIAQPHSSIEEMAHDYLHEMREYQPAGPYFIAGYSGGGSIALEMAAILRQHGEEVPVVLLLDSYHPDVQNRRLTPAEHLRNALEYPLHFVYQRIARQFERVQHVLRQRALREILENKRHIPLELRDLYVSSHLSALRRKHSLGAYDGSVILYRATKVWQVYDHIGRDLGWGSTLNNLKIVDVEGDHDDLIREPNVRDLLLQVSKAIRQHRK